MSRWILGLALVLALGCADSRADHSPGVEATATFTVSGTIRYPSKGTIYVFLADREAFETPLHGIHELTLSPSDDGGKVAYRFSDVPAGTYAIRAFQDVNGNGKLDRGALGPKEPWGMSFAPGKTRGFGPPKFDDVSFSVEADVTGLAIELRGRD